MAFLLLPTASLASAQTSSHSVTIIQHVTVVDVETGEERKDQTVRIEGTTILSVAPAQQADSSSPQTTGPGAIDAHGGFLIPGLWDMHVHVQQNSELPLYVANGVTGVRMMAGDKDTAALRAELSKETPSPYIYLASAIVDGPSPTWPGSIVVRKPADARRAVDEIKAGGADFIKVYDGIPRDAYLALADEAKLRQIDFEGHVPRAITAQEASAAGQRSIEHLTGVALACSSRQEFLDPEMQRAPFFRDRLNIEAQAYRSLDRAKCNALLAEFRSNDTWQVPTLTVKRIWGRLDDPKTTSDPRLAYIEHSARDRWSDRIQPQIRRWSNSEYLLARAVFAVDESVVGNMYRAGVPLMAGTDAMNPYCFPGFSLHDELALLVESGLTPLAALQTATINPAKFLKRTAELGSIAAGKRADLVLLRADPLADIHNTTQIQAVWLDGAYFDEAALSRLLRDAREQAKR